MKDRLFVGKNLAEKIIVQRGQPSKGQYLGPTQDSRMVSTEWYLNAPMVSPLEVLDLVLSLSFSLIK